MRNKLLGAFASQAETGPGQHGGSGVSLSFLLSDRTHLLVQRRYVPITLFVHAFTLSLKA